MGLNTHSLALLNDGTVKGFGYNGLGQLGLGNTTTPYTTPTLIPNLTNIKQVVCGNNHSLVLLNDGTVKSFGNNAGGQLGLGNITNISTPTLIPNLTNVNLLWDIVYRRETFIIILTNDSAAYASI